jgi:hypothetical protein
MAMIAVNLKFISKKGGIFRENKRVKGLRNLFGYYLIEVFLCVIVVA